MRKVAFLIPIYPPHFAYANLFIKSFKKFGYQKQADLWFIFTNEEEKEQFGEWKNSIILPPELRIFENRGIINIKKFYGLSQIKDKYEFAIVLDSESNLIKEIDLADICNQYFSNKILIGNETENETTAKIKQITDNCKRYFNNYENKKILDTDLYLWFNQPCIYKLSTLDEFFKITNMQENIYNLKWEDFDYYIYMYYLILFQGFKIHDIGIKAPYSFVEINTVQPEFKNNNYQNYPIFLCTDYTKKYFESDNLFLQIHIDRDAYYEINFLNKKLTYYINRVNILEKRFSRIEKLLENSFSFKLRKFLSIFIFDKKKRQKFRGDLR